LHGVARCTRLHAGTDLHGHLPFLEQVIRLKADYLNFPVKPCQALPIWFATLSAWAPAELTKLETWASALPIARWALSK
jgi:hypothetical protein